MLNFYRQFLSEIVKVMLPLICMQMGKRELYINKDASQWCALA